MVCREGRPLEENQASRAGSAQARAANTRRVGRAKWLQVRSTRGGNGGLRRGRLALVVVASC
jgi:hypothetical protein